MEKKKTITIEVENCLSVSELGIEQLVFKVNKMITLAELQTRSVEAMTNHMKEYDKIVDGDDVALLMWRVKKDMIIGSFFSLLQEVKSTSFDSMKAKGGMLSPNIRDWWSKSYSKEN